MRGPHGRPGSADPSRRDQWGRRRHHRLFWPVIASLGYLVSVLAVTAAEYLSEMSKLSRGFFTDTVSPFVFTNLLTFPTSAVHSAWHGYPDEFDETQWKQQIRDAVGPLVVNTLVPAALVAAVVSLVGIRQRRAENPTGPEAS